MLLPRSAVEPCCTTYPVSPSCRKSKDDVAKAKPDAAGPSRRMKKPPPQPKQSTGYLDGDFLPSSDDGDSDQEVVEREEKVVDMSQQVLQSLLPNNRNNNVEAIGTQIGSRGIHPTAFLCWSNQTGSTSTSVRATMHMQKRPVSN